MNLLGLSLPIDLVIDFSSNRVQIAKIGNPLGKLFKIKHFVLQDSVLGQLFFNIYVNDIHSITYNKFNHSHLHQYADNTSK